MKRLVSWQWSDDVLGKRWRECRDYYSDLRRPDTMGVVLRNDGAYALIPTINDTRSRRMFPVTIWDCRSGNAVGQMVSSDSWQNIKKMSFTPDGKGVVAIMNKRDHINKNDDPSCCKYWNIPAGGSGEKIIEGGVALEKVLVSHDGNTIVLDWNGEALYVFKRK